VQSYGKAAIVGTAGEQEHANAVLMSAFGDAFRKAIGGGAAPEVSRTPVSGVNAERSAPAPGRVAFLIWLMHPGRHSVR
jgi:hypothetical protein